jgi:hypothetical protein
MGRMVPRLCGYLTDTRQLPFQPIGQHKVTSDAVGFENEDKIDGSYGQYTSRQVMWTKQIADRYSDSNEIGSALDGWFSTSPSEVCHTSGGES